MVARVYVRGLMVGRIDYVEDYSEGYATCIIRTLVGQERITVPYAAIELEIR